MKPATFWAATALAFAPAAAATPELGQPVRPDAPKPLPHGAPCMASILYEGTRLALDNRRVLLAEVERRLAQEVDGTHRHNELTGIQAQLKTEIKQREERLRALVPMVRQDATACGVERGDRF